MSLLVCGKCGKVDNSNLIGACGLTDKVKDGFPNLSLMEMHIGETFLKKYMLKPSILCFKCNTGYDHNEFDMEYPDIQELLIALNTQENIITGGYADKTEEPKPNDTLHQNSGLIYEFLEIINVPEILQDIEYTKVKDNLLESTPFILNDITYKVVLLSKEQFNNIKLNLDDFYWERVGIQKYATIVEIKNERK